MFILQEISSLNDLIQSIWQFLTVFFWRFKLFVFFTYSCHYFIIKLLWMLLVKRWKWERKLPFENFRLCQCCLSFSVFRTVQTCKLNILPNFTITSEMQKARLHFWIFFFYLFFILNFYINFLFSGNIWCKM